MFFFKATSSKLSRFYLPNLYFWTCCFVLIVFKITNQIVFSVPNLPVDVMNKQTKKMKKQQGIDVHNMSSPLLGLEKADWTAAFNYSFLVVTLTDDTHFYCRQLSIDSIILWHFDTVWFSESL